MNKHLKSIVIVGAGTAGLTLANKLARKGFKPTLIDPNSYHFYQPGLLPVVFKQIKLEKLKKSLIGLVNNKVNYIADKVIAVEPNKNQVVLANNDTVSYDALVIATGTYADVNMTEGLMCDQLYKNIFEFYTPEGATALSEALENFSSGHLVMQIMEMPIKCPVAPLEFCFLADDYFKKRGVRQNIQISYVTPMSGAFTKPVASAKLSSLLSDKNINLVSDFYAEKVVGSENKIVSYDDREVKYDMLVTVPVNVGMKFLQKLDFTSELGFVKVNKHSLQSTAYQNIFSLGDAAEVPTSKAGSVAHFETETVLNNIENFLDNKPMEESFDGHTNCFVELGGGKALLLDFNYDQEPLEGTFPIAGLGPMKLLGASRINHIGKLAFRHIYWLMLLPGRKIPLITDHMTLKGKKIPTKEEAQ